jgi:hypothetical protein
MSARPKRNVVVNRPPTDILSGNMRRRSSAQVKKDLEAESAAKTAAEQLMNTAKHQQQARIANLEDILRKEDRLWTTSRPDLQAVKTRPKARIVLCHQCTLIIYISQLFHKWAKK